MVRHILLSLIAVTLFLATVQGQGRTAEKERSTFGLSVLAGMNFSQIDGDNFKGYNNIGFYGGLRGITRLSERFEIHIELLYSQKGSKFESRSSINSSGERNRYIKLDYAEIPITAAFRATGEYSRSELWLEAGVSIARLIDSDVMDSPSPSDKEFLFSTIEGEFSKSDFSLVAGIQFNPAPFLGFGLRGTWGLVRFYDNEFYTQSELKETVDFLRNYSLSLFALYHF